MRVVLALASTLLWASLVPAHSLLAVARPDEGKAIKAFQKAFRPARKGQSPDSSARRSAVQGLAPYDSERVAKALLKGFGVVLKEIGGAEAVLKEHNDRFAKVMESTRRVGNRLQFSSAGAQQEWQNLRTKIPTLSRAVGELRDTLSLVGQRVSELRDPKAIVWLLKNVSGKKRQPIYLKTKVAQAAGSAGKDSLPALEAALKKSKAPQEIAALLIGVGHLAKDALPISPVVIGLMKHEASIVRESAALAASRICDPRSIEPMIDLLGRCYGQGKKRVAAYLEALTRQKHGTSASTWKRWFAAEGAKYAAGKMQLGGGAPSSRTDKSKNYYFGIPQDGKSIIYIIDASGSMKAPIKLNLPSKPSGRTVAKSDDDSKKETTRLEACKSELIRALGRLEPTTKFNVIWYSDQPHMFLKSMENAAPATIQKAQAWVRKLTPSGSTNIHDSMQMAFQLTGLVPGAASKGPLTGKKLEATPDTVFLLSDGSPTTPDGKLDSTEKIIKAVRDWNSLKSVTIHCIGIGRGVNEPFMSKLAQENGGEFKKFL